jgi:glycosyltransferase involved in cell wall biosynthesis
MPSLTVIMPAFQAAATIERAIASVVAQTFTDWELIVIDDASTDQTAAIGEHWAARDPRISVIKLERNQGAAAAMNCGWQSTQAPFIAIHDADDESLPGRLAAQLAFMQSHPEVHVLGGGAQFVDEAGRTLAWVRHPREHAELAARRWRQSPFVHSTVVMRREFLIATGGYPAGMRLAEDFDLWMRGFADGRFRYHNLAEILVLYRTRSVQRWKMIRASAGARIKAGCREHRPITGWTAAAWILLNGVLEQSRIFVLRDALKNFFGAELAAPSRVGLPLGPRPLRMALVTSSLGGGGAERVLATMANHWAGLGWEVTVFTLRADEATTAYPLHERVRVVRLNLIRERNPVWDLGHLGRLLALRRALRSAAPDVVISFLDKLNVAVLLALVGTGTRVVVTEHLVPWRHPLGAVWETLRRIVYRRAARIVSPTAGIRDYLAQRVPGRYTVLGYPAQLLSGAVSAVTRRAPLIFAAGRLAPEKGFDVLIAAFVRVHAQHPAWRLEIAGEGPLRSALAEQIEAAGLGESVALRGHVPTARERMCDAAIFVLASRNEAYPMVVCEAMAAGAAVVATDCPTGPREIITAGVDGLLVPPDDAPALAEALLKLITNAALREKLAAAAHVGARRFASETVMPQWDGLVRQVMAETR